MRPRLTPAVADVRRAVRESLRTLSERSETKGPNPLVLVALSGGPDSLALAAATAFEAPRAGLRAGAVIVDHGIQAGSDAVAEHAAVQVRELGLDPVLVRAVSVPGRSLSGVEGRSLSGVEGSGPYPGPEAAARTARYEAIDTALDECGADAVLLGHTLDDQAETVLLGLARGAGATSLQGMSAASGRYLRPLLGIRRATTLAACDDQGLEPWQDPQNADPVFTRVRVRHTVLPLLEAELGPSVAEALARTAEQLREDATALDAMTEEVAEDLADHADGGISFPVAALAANPAALRHRLIRFAVSAEFGRSLTRAQTLEVARLITDWHGQGPVDLPGATAERLGGRIVFSARAD